MRHPHRTPSAESGAGDAMFRDNSRPAAPYNLLGRPAGLIAKGGQPVPTPAGGPHAYWAVDPARHVGLD